MATASPVSEKRRLRWRREICVPLLLAILAGTAACRDGSTLPDGCDAILKKRAPGDPPLECADGDRCVALRFRNDVRVYATVGLAKSITNGDAAMTQFSEAEQLENQRCIAALLESRGFDVDITTPRGTIFSDVDVFEVPLGKLWSAVEDVAIAVEIAIGCLPSKTCVQFCNGQSPGGCIGPCAAASGWIIENGVTQNDRVPLVCLPVDVPCSQASIERPLRNTKTNVCAVIPELCNLVSAPDWIVDESCQTVQ